MRISDWSSDVCSSDLGPMARRVQHGGTFFAKCCTAPRWSGPRIRDAFRTGLSTTKSTKEHEEGKPALAPKVPSCCFVSFVVPFGHGTPLRGGCGFLRFHGVFGGCRETPCNTFRGMLHGAGWTAPLG